MRDRLFSLRDIDAGEKYTVSMLLVQALFLGIFIGAFDIGAHSVFLAVFDEKVLAKGYIISGLAGMIFLAGYFFLQTKVNPKNFVSVSLFLIGIITLILWFIVSSGHSGWGIFTAFIMFGPLNVVSVSVFRSHAGTVLEQMNRKRFMIKTDTFLIIGVIVVSFAIPLLGYLKFPLHNVLLISALSVIFAAIMHLITERNRSMPPSVPDNQPDSFNKIFSVFNIFRDDGYIRTIAAFVIISVVCAFFIQYTFLAVTRVKYPAGEQIAAFLGIFTGSIMLVALAGKMVMFSGLLKNYGLKICLIISPFLLACVTVLLIIAGLLMGYTREAIGGFAVFFIMVSILRFFSRALEESVDSQSFKLICQTIDEKLRPGVQTFMDSAVREASVFFAGLILAGAGILSFIRLIHFPVMLLVLLVAWIYVALKLFSEYRKSIQQGLESSVGTGSEKTVIIGRDTFVNRFYGERVFRLDYFNLICGDFTYLEKAGNRFYFQKILDHSVARKDINLLPAVKKMTGSRFDHDIRKQAADLLKNFEALLPVQRIDDERIAAAKRVLSESRMPQTTEILRLLRDKSIESKRLAIYLIGKFKLSDMLPEVCECLNIQGLESDTTAVLSSFGSTAEEELIRFYLVSSGNLNASKTILRLLSRFPLNEGPGFLFSRLWSNSRQLKEVALQCLTDTSFSPTLEDKERLNLLISDVTGIITWTLTAKRCLERNNDTVVLTQMIKELNRWNSFLINLLSLAYDPAIMSRIKKNLEPGTIESVHYAHAVIDIVFDESIKTKLICLLDIIPDEDKLHNLNHFFPVEIPDYNNLLEDILNRDYNLLSIWTKACVLRNMKQIRNSEMAESVVALLFSPENILQEEAVKLIARSDISLYRSVFNRIPLSVRKNLDRITEGEMGKCEFLFDKVLFLSGLIEGVVEDEMLYLARKLSFSDDIREAVSSFPDGFILWVMRPDNDFFPAQIAYSSNVEELLEKVNLTGHKSGYIISFKAIDEFLYQYPAYEERVMSVIENIEK
jgi:AAA family ATP:ADP antiporter